jgi:hypothetical protein
MRSFSSVPRATLPTSRYFSHCKELSKEQLKLLRQSYDDIAQTGLPPVAQLDSDANRIKIDDCLSKVLGIPDLRSVRALLAREPGLNAIEINPRQETNEESEDDDPEDDDQAEMTL